MAGNSMPVVLLAFGLVIAFGATRAFVGAPAIGARQGSLRAAGAAQSPQAPSSAGSSAGLLAACSAGSLLAAAAAAAASHRRRESAVQLLAAKKKEAFEIEAIPRPEDLLESPKFPLYTGSTDGYMARATRERHAITWTSKEAYYFEMPTVGFAIMNKGENLCYFRRKEQCIALGKQLRKMKIENYKIYRIKKDGTVIFMHPADGVFPEKVNKGRVQVNGRPFSIGNNPQPGELTWTKYQMKSWEADPLTTMFVKARLTAWNDQENLFALPNPDSWIAQEDMPEFVAKMQGKMESM